MTEAQIRIRTTAKIQRIIGKPRIARVITMRLPNATWVEDGLMADIAQRELERREGAAVTDTAPGHPDIAVVDGAGF